MEFPGKFDFPGIFQDLAFLLNLTGLSLFAFENSASEVSLPFRVAIPTRPFSFHERPMAAHTPQGSSPDGSEMRPQESQVCIDQARLDEKATIAELVLAASKTQHGVDSVHSWLLYFREEAIGRAYESRQVGTAFTTVILAAFMAIVGTSLRLIRVAWGIETVLEAYETEQVWMIIFTLVVHLFVVGCAIYVRNSCCMHAVFWHWQQRQ